MLVRRLEVQRVDGAAAWNVQVCSAGKLYGTWFEPETARAVAVLRRQRRGSSALQPFDTLGPMARLTDLVDELRRRKLFRLAAMYAVAGWVVLQVGEVTFEPLGLPEGSLRALILLVLLGFPVTMALGWIFDWTPEGLVRTPPAASEGGRAEAPSATALRWRRVALVAVALLLGYVGLRAYTFWSEVRWAQDVAQPELVRRMEVNDFHGAFTLAREMEERLGAMPALAPVWAVISAPVAFETDPPGARVSYRSFEDVDGAWTEVGVTPIGEVRVPRGPSLWRIEKAGYVTREFARAPATIPMPAFRWPEHWVLDPIDAVSGDVVALEARSYLQVSLGGFPITEGYELERSYVDRTEVRNRDYLEFVEAGGYAQEALWQEPFVEGDRRLGFREAMARFVDASGRPGPATWIGGRPPPGQEDHPVAGVSWYEAMAYARFRGRALPTVYHWAAAALPDIEIGEPIAPALAAQSNLEGQGTLPVGTTSGRSAAGALDMFGNVAEWVSTARGDQERFVLGLGWSDPAFNVSLATAASPWSRRPTQGLRLADYPSGPPKEELLAAVEVSPIDYDALELLSDEALDLIAPPVDRARAIHVVSEETVPLDLGDLTATRLEIRSSSLGAESFRLYVVAPQDAEPPYGAAIWFSGLNAIVSRDDASLLYSASFVEFIRSSGRMVVLPVWTGTFSRNDGSTFQRFMSGGEELHELASAWSTDLGLAIDYLGTREDVDEEAIAFVGLSLGAMVGSMILPRNERVRAAMFWSGGFAAAASPEENTRLASLARRIRQPVLMLNGRYDFVFPLKGQQAYYRYLGAPAEHKRYVVYDAGHFGWPLGAFVRENLDWMDRYLGEVRRPASRLASGSATPSPGT